MGPYILWGVVTVLLLFFTIGKLIGKNPIPDRYSAIFVYDNEKDWARAIDAMPLPLLARDDTAHVKRCVYAGVILDLASKEALIQLAGCTRGHAIVTRNPIQEAAEFVGIGKRRQLVIDPDPVLGKGLMALVLLPESKEFYVFRKNFIALLRDQKRRARR